MVKLFRENLIWRFFSLFLSVEPAYLVVLCEEELVVIDLLTKETGYVTQFVLVWTQSCQKYFK